MNKATILGATLALLVASSGQAQSRRAIEDGPQDHSLIGSWSWISRGPSGMDQNLITFTVDGAYTRTSRLANGTLLRSWGHYQSSPEGSGMVRLSSQIDGWLPQKMCAQAPGFAVQCQRAPRPPEMNFAVKLSSPSTLEVQGVTLRRDAHAALTHVQVPLMAMSQAQAPVQPSMRQPVMPTLHPYQTPNGPGLGIANANHQGAQDFVNGYMRGCYKDEQGRLWGCEQ